MMPKVLLVEDELLIRLSMKQEFEHLGCSVVGEASEGNRAIELARQLRPELICMDIRIQGPMDGIEVARRIREFSSAFILFTSAYIRNDESFCTDFAPCSCLSKPLPPDSLASWLAKQRL